MSTNGQIVIDSKLSMWTATCKLYDDWNNKDNLNSGDFSIVIVFLNINISFYIFSKWKLGYMARLEFMFSDMW